MEHSNQTRLARSSLDRFFIFLATGFGIGFLSDLVPIRTLNFRMKSSQRRLTGSGFLGSCIGFGLVWMGLPLSGWPGFILLCAFTMIAILISDRAETLLGIHDDSRIVIDEIFGFFWAVLFVPLDSLSEPQRISLLVTGFILFRIFDLLKLPFKQAQNLRGGLGVVADDLLAGLLTNLILQIGIRLIF